MRPGLMGRLLTACLLLGLVGCGGRQQQAVEFNNALTKVNQQLQQAQVDFFNAMNAVRSSGELKIDEVRAAHGELVATLDNVKAEAEQIIVPESDDAKAFFQAQQAYITSEEQVIKKDYQEMLDVLASTEINAVEKDGKLQAIAERVSKAQEKSLAEVQAAQETFAKEFGLKLTSNSGDE